MKIYSPSRSPPSRGQRCGGGSSSSQKAHQTALSFLLSPPRLYPGQEKRSRRRDGVECMRPLPSAAVTRPPATALALAENKSAPKLCPSSSSRMCEFSLPARARVGVCGCVCVCWSCQPAHPKPSIHPSLIPSLLLLSLASLVLPPPIEFTTWQERTDRDSILRRVFFPPSRAAEQKNA